tara:strand:+ start:847 stop:1095 length:249 start_codon:yes stop_codon:yes gene_type:complete
MSEEIKKITEEELQQLKSIKERTNILINELGQIGLAEINLDRRRENAENFLDETKKLENDLVKALSDKYGDGNIDLETGIIS